jgi:DNA polymerase-3 subunit epsilon
MGILAFDLETTGLNPESDRIVEFCFIEMDDDMNEVSRWTQRINPGVPIPAETTVIHGISDADVAEEPPIKEFVGKIQALMANHTLMAYNHGFDMNTMHYELVRNGGAGLDMSHPVIDPLVIFRTHKPHSLAGAVKHYMDEDLENAHSAEADTQAMVNVFKAQMASHGLEGGAQGQLVKRDRVFLDRAKRFYEDANGIVHFGFGKHRHEPVEPNISYVQWMLGKDFSEDTKDVGRKLVNRFLK